MHPGGFHVPLHDSSWHFSSSPITSEVMDVIIISEQMPCCVDEKQETGSQGGGGGNSWYYFVKFTG